ncbi:hypothetical protein, partial [Pseudothauera rhizosphaerae]|uniref:hypothetical protein n=1 Tax=Pseudothauera rhizosphaerae TaxID=2565932 RepID=UPI001B3B22AC
GVLQLGKARLHRPTSCHSNTASIISSASLCRGAGGGINQRFPYGALRNFADRVLASAPNIALDGFVMRRQRASDPIVEAELRLTLRFAAP